MPPSILPLLLASATIATPGPELDPTQDPCLSATWLPIEISQGVMALQAEVSLPGWLGLAASVGTDGRPFSKGTPLEGAVQMRYYFLRPFSGFQVGALAGSVRSTHGEWIHQAAPIAGYKWIATSGFTADVLGGWSWVWGDRQQAGHLLYSVGLGYTW